MSGPAKLSKAGDKRLPADGRPPSPLLLAVWSGAVDDVHRLLAAGADPNELTHGGDSALHLAVRGIPRAVPPLVFSILHTVRV